MTRSKWEKMTLLDQQLKVLELAGENWEIKPYDGISRWKRNGVSVMGHIVPRNVLNDLNVMHDIEKLLKDDKPIGVYSPASTYRGFLYRIVERDGGNSVGWGHATAAQRAEAFVLTMDKE